MVQKPCLRVQEADQKENGARTLIPDVHITVPQADTLSGLGDLGHK